MRQKYKESLTQKSPLKQNPYTKPNPYKIKTKLYSTQNKKARQRYLSTGSNDPPHNPESLFYKRNYKETPPMQPNSHVSLLHQSRFIMGESHGFGVSAVDYKVKLNNYLAQKFCPTDGYLQALKDKFAFFATDKDSQFQNLMRTSHFSKVKCYINDNKNANHSNVHKENPFLRKNLISASSQKSEYDTLYNSILYTASNYVPASSQVNYTSNAINDSFVSSAPFETVQPKLSGKQSGIQRRVSGMHQSTVYDAGPNYAGDKRSLDNDSPKSIRSFGPQRWLQGRKKILSFVDAVIEKSLDHNELEEKAPKEITINGKKFALNNVKRAKG